MADSTDGGQAPGLTRVSSWRASSLRVRLVGPAGNPSAIGATIRVVYADGMGLAREGHGGAGYWSYDDPVQVMGLRATPQAVWIRWPGGEETTTPVEADALEILVRGR